MKNITLSIQDELLTAGREYARKHHTSLNQLIRELLKKTVQRNKHDTQLNNLLLLMKNAGGNSRGQKWSREDLYNG